MFSNEENIVYIYFSITKYHKIIDQGSHYDFT